MNKLIDFIKSPIENGATHIGLPVMPLHTINKTLLELGFSEREYQDNPLNGWDVDFWYYYNHPIYGRWCLSGGLWNGDYKIYKDEKDTTEEG